MLTRPTRVYRRPAPDPIAKEWTATGRQGPPQLPAGDGKSRIPRSGPWSTDLRVEPGLLVVVERGVVQGGALKLATAGRGDQHDRWASRAERRRRRARAAIPGAPSAERDLQPHADRYGEVVEPIGEPGVGMGWHFGHLPTNAAA